MAAVKFAPFRNNERASATAAYEHDDEAAPSKAIARDPRESSGKSRLISRIDSTAKPRINGQKISQNMANAV
jgi:hypothetical protein